MNHLRFFVPAALLLAACVDRPAEESVGEESQALGQRIEAPVIVPQNGTHNVTLKRGVIELDPPADDLTTGDHRPPSADDFTSGDEPPPPPPPPGSDDVADVPDAPFSFTLTPIAPVKTFAGGLNYHYPRDVDTHWGEGSVTFSTNRLYWSDGYVDYRLRLEEDKDYEVEICLSQGDPTTVRHEIGGVVTYVEVSGDDCQLTLLLDAEATGWVSGRIGFAEDETESTFTFDRIEVREVE
jgi:hypothetical protein